MYGFPSSGQKIEAAYFYETLVTICQIRRYHVPESNLQIGTEVFIAVIIKSFYFLEYNAV
jgi:hypothetical protein